MTDKQLILNSLETIRPYLQKDGGDIELVEVSEDGDVVVKLLGACSSCSMNEMTMAAGVEQTIRSAAPNVKKITAIKD